MREEASFRMFFEKVRASKQKLEIDDPKPPKTGKVLSHYGEGSFYLTRNIHCNYSGNGNNAFKSVV